MIHQKWREASPLQKALALLLPVLVYRFLFLLNVGLIDDEAYHWSWAKEPALSYFDHPGLIAWLEMLSTTWLGDTNLGVRLPSFICYLGTLAVGWRLAREMFDEWTGFFVAFALLFTPLWGIAGYVASPEPPFMFLWTLAAWVFWQGVREDGKAWSVKKLWLVLGVLMGVGLNAKFPMAMLAPGFGVYLLLSRRRDLLQPWPWLGILIASLLCLPIFLWNVQADWPGFRYQFHDRHTGESFNVGRWLGWFGAQLIFLSPVLYAMVLLAFVRGWLERRDPRWRFLFSLAVPSILIFAIQPFFADYKPHWSGPGYYLLTIGAGVIWSQGWTWDDRQIIAPRARWVSWGIAGVLLPLTILVYSTFWMPWLPKLHRALNPTGTWNTTWDPSNEFHGWQELGDLVNLRQREIHARTGRRPFLAALRYETTAQTYWGTKQKTYQMAFTRSHYTVMQNLTHDFDNMKGLDALVVTTEKYPAKPIEWGRFDSCEPEILEVRRDAELARTFTVWSCRNFQGVLK